MVDPDMQPLVFDLGTDTAKIGFSGDDVPKSIFPNVVGRSKYPELQIGVNENQKDDIHKYFGDEALGKRGVLRLSYPMDRGRIVKFKDMEMILAHSFYNELRVTPEEHPVLLTEHVFNPKKNREKLISSIFETFNCPASFIGLSGMLNVYASGRCSAISVDIGEGCITTLPVYEGYSPLGGLQRCNIGGKDITEYMAKVMREDKREGFCPETSAELEIVKHIKEKHSFISSDFDRDFIRGDFQTRTRNCSYSTLIQSLHTCFESYRPLFQVLPGDTINIVHQFMYNPIPKEKWNVDYELPDGRKIALGDERFRGPEVLFRPGWIGKSETNSLPKLIKKAFKGLPRDCRKDFFSNILLSGGTSMITGIKERLLKEVEQFTPKALRRRGWGPPKLVMPSERMISTFIGGSILSSLSTFQNMWITIDEFHDAGPTIVHRKCF